MRTESLQEHERFSSRQCEELRVPEEVQDAGVFGLTPLAKHCYIIAYLISHPAPPPKPRYLEDELPNFRGAQKLVFDWISVRGHFTRQDVSNALPHVKVITVKKALEKLRKMEIIEWDGDCWRLM